MTTPTAPPRWARVLLVVEALLTLAALAALGLGLLMIGFDEADPAEKFDGLGTALGLVVGLGALFALAVLAVPLTVLRTGLRRRDPVRLRRAGLLATLLGVPWPLWSVYLAFAGAEAPGILLVLGLGLVLLVPAIGTVRAANRAVIPKADEASGVDPGHEGQDQPRS